MKKLFEPFIIILSVYTRIPMPMAYWNSSNLKYAFCLLPVAGLVTGAAQAAWTALVCATELSPVLGAAIACTVPLLVTGGIHMDGFSDTMDALSSHAECQKKLEIMDDPHMGAFGVMWMIVYMLLCSASYYEILSNAAQSTSLTAMLILLLVIPVISRSVTAFAISHIEPSKKKGMLYTFTSASDMKAVAAASLAVTAAALAVLAYVSAIFAAICTCIVILLFLYFKRMTLKEFGGISGDLCGWLIQISELLMLIAAAVMVDTSTLL